MFQHILLPTDGSELTSKAVETAVKLAQALGAQLSIVSIKEPFPYSAISEMQPVVPQDYFDAQERIAQKRVKAAMEICESAKVPCKAHTVEALHPWEAIIDVAKTQQCDLIIMASHGRRGVSAMLLGSETQKVLTHSKIPVLVVR